MGDERITLTTTTRLRMHRLLICPVDILYCTSLVLSSNTRTRQHQQQPEETKPEVRHQDSPSQHQPKKENKKDSSMSRQKAQALTILTTHSNKPFKSSRLAVPPSPFSPQYPITPLPRPAELTHPAPTRPEPSSSSQDPCAPPPPCNPLNWLWQCHVCHRTYRLGTTRRCLDDGHYFCSGATVVKKRGKRGGGKKVLRHRACQSEFDYQGWKAWGSWRRRVDAAALGRALREGTGVMVFGIEGLEAERRSGGRRRDSGVGCGGEGKDCWNQCDYPSECRWGRQFGVRTPSPPPPPPRVSVPSSPLPTIETQVAEDGSVDVSEILLSSIAENSTASPFDDEAKKPSMDDLLASAKRRKRRSAGAAPSPLASNLSSFALEEAEENDEPKAAGAFQQSVDDLELDVQKSFSGLISGLGMGRRESAPTTMASDAEQERNAECSWTRMKPKEKSPSRRANGDM